MLFSPKRNAPTLHPGENYRFTASSWRKLQIQWPVTASAENLISGSATTCQKGQNVTMLWRPWSPQAPSLQRWLRDEALVVPGLTKPKGSLGILNKQRQFIQLPSRKYCKAVAISNAMVIINSNISHQSRATEPRGKYDVRNMALQGNQEIKETNTQPEGKFSSSWTCLLLEQRSLWEIWGLEETGQRIKDTTEQMQQKKCCALLQKIQRASWVHWIQRKKF